MDRRYHAASLIPDESKIIAPALIGRILFQRQKQVVTIDLILSKTSCPNKRFTKL